MQRKSGRNLGNRAHRAMVDSELSNGGKLAGVHYWSRQWWWLTEDAQQLPSRLPLRLHYTPPRPTARCTEEGNEERRKMNSGNTTVVHDGRPSLVSLFFSSSLSFLLTTSASRGMEDRKWPAEASSRSL